MRIALIQMPVLPDKVKNIQTACGKIREAAKNGADFAVLPEMFCCPYDNSCFGAYGEPEGGEAQTALSHLAAELGLYLVGGTVPELSEGRIYNTSYVYGPDGRQLAKHRKAHLFDIDVQGGQRFRESDTLSPGNAITTFETAFGTMGLCVCFDLRFEELGETDEKETQITVLKAQNTWFYYDRSSGKYIYSNSDERGHCGGLLPPAHRLLPAL